MKSKRFVFFSLFSILFLASAACAIPTDLLGGTSEPVVETVVVEVQVTPQPVDTLVPGSNATADGPVLLTGTFTYSNDFYPEGYAYEQAVSLLDVTGFVLRDENWTLPVESQVLGYLDMDYDNNSGTYRLSLPIRPAGTMNDVDQDGQAEAGVQIFAVEYSPNWTGGPFYEGDDPFMGWPSYLASVKTNSENQDEITGGKLIVWSPDDAQDFPTGFGEDGMLFTADDPVGPLPAGYSIIDLDQQPFASRRDQVSDITLYEPTDVAVKDFSGQSYTEAFNSMFELVKKEYAFNGVEGKVPDWDALYAEIYPKVQSAEQSGNAYDYFLALREFSLAFKDGHVSVDGGDLAVQYNSRYITGGYGVSIRELDDGRSIVVYLVPDSPASQAGMRLGAEITAVDGVPVAEAIGRVKPFSPQSTDYGLRYEQAIFLLRGEVGVKKEITFANPGEGSQTVNLTSVWEMDSLFATYLGGTFDENVLPVEYQVLPSGIGYIRINSNSDDLNLAYRIFERALQTFEDVQAVGLIVDLRLNFGGSPLGVAGYLTDQEIQLGQLQYYSDKTGQFEPEGDPDRILPMVEQYSFGKMVLLVDQFCYSACEIEAYGLSQVPGMEVMGQFPTAGVEAETARGDFKLPEGISVTVPTGRFVLQDGSIFLEGVGVIPDMDIPVDEESVLSTEDTVLNAAEEYILQ
ncbi:MAG: peptidase S41 [Chloroflexi bacterium]|nr:peptidase S41 [Chloroflexota bacterium]